MIESIKKIENPKLITAIKECRDKKTEEKETELIESIKEAFFLIPVVYDEDIISDGIKEDVNISVCTVINDREETFFAVFTDWKELKNWSESHHQALVVRYDDLSKMILPNPKISGFVINPFNENLVLTPAVMEYFNSVVKNKEERH